MSLINDALKQASQAEKTRRREPAQPPAMQPAPESHRSVVPVLLGVWIFFILLIIAGWSLWRAISQRHNSAPVPAAGPSNEVGTPRRGVQAPALDPAKMEPSTDVSGGAAAPPYRAAPLPAAGPSNEVGTPRRGVQAPAMDPAKLEASTNVSGGAAAPPYQASPTPPAFPELKLQSIFFSRNNPRASINGQIRAENDLVGEVRVVTISSNKVTVEWNGRTKDLILKGP